MLTDWPFFLLLASRQNQIYSALILHQMSNFDWHRQLAPLYLTHDTCLGVDQQQRPFPIWLANISYFCIWTIPSRPWNLEINRNSMKADDEMRSIFNWSKSMNRWTRSIKSGFSPCLSTALMLSVSKVSYMKEFQVNSVLVQLYQSERYARHVVVNGYTTVKVVLNAIWPIRFGNITAN